MQKKAARRGQRALAFLLCLLMVATLLPVMGASAAEGDVSATGVELNKTLTLQNDGTYAITLEAYATGTVTSTTVTEPVPTDFVLVLDQSGSMAENITSYTYNATPRQEYSYSSYGDQKLYYKDGDAYYQVKRDYDTTGHLIWTTYHYYLYYQKDGTIYYLSKTGTTTTCPSEYTNSSDTIWTGVLYTQTKTSQTKLAALKNAVTNFVTSVQNQKDANGTPVDHRIAIVGFGSGYDENKYEGYDKGAFNYANTELFIGSKQYNYAQGGKESNQSQVASTQYGNALQRVNDPAGSQNLTASINALAAFGGTYPQLGFEMANGIFEAYHKQNDYQYTNANGDRANRGKVVVMFTDGEPGNNNNDDRIAVANNTIANAKTAKETHQAKVFTIGIFDKSDTTKLVSKGNTSSYSIKDYMTAVSSDYPAAESLISMGSRNTDGKEYYATADDSEALNDAFQSVSSSVTSSSTSCVLDAASVLTDVISGNLDLPANFSEANNVKVYTATCNGTDKDGKLTWQAKMLFNATVTTDGKAVNVSGFDYSQNYVTGEANKGNKLIVTITGLLPNRDGTKLPSNETTSGIYDDDKLVAPFEVPTFNVGLENRVVDFGMTVNIADNVLNTNAATHEYGTFSRNSNKYTYNLNSVKDGNDNYMFGFTGVDSSLYFADGSWNKVNVIPANNVYYDDAYLNGGDTGSSTFTDGQYGYEAKVPATTDTTSVSSGETTFTFKGRRIDVYCTTESSSGAVIGQLKAADGTVVATKLMRNEYKSGALYNVPTLSFETPDASATYTLTITTNDQSNYKLDGVRVYHPADETNETVQNAYANDDEQNAVFTQVRKILLTANSFGEGPYSGVAISGVVYTDATREGSHTHDTNNVAETYKDLGPKNEVYLANGNGIAFKIPNYNGQKVMIGLSAPETAASGTVTATMGSAPQTIKIKSNVDMYYEVTPTSEGYVFIKNTSDALIAVTNVKVSGTAADAESLCVDADLLSYVADFDTLAVVQPEPEPTPDPEPAVSNNTVSAIIHAIWASVKTSIDRLFGRL